MRSVSQIYAEAVNTRNNYLQLTELNSGRSNSKLSIINLLTYVVAVCIHTYEAIIDLYQTRLTEVLNGRINGTPDWYVMAAKKFQYNPVTQSGDKLIFNEDTMKVEYETTDASRRIVEQAAWQINSDGNALTLKVCKTNNNGNEVNNGIPYIQLSDTELTAFRTYIQQIKFIGANVYCKSLPGDILIIDAKESPIYYDDGYVTATQALTKIKESMIEFANTMEFNGILYYQAVLDVIRKTEYITNIGSDIKIYVMSYNASDRKYDEKVLLQNRMRLRSGYIRLLDEDSAPTVNSDNITLLPYSQMSDSEKAFDSND